MNNERKIQRLKKQLEAANELNKELRCRNTALAVENHSLKNTIDALQVSIDALNEEMVKNRAEHIKAMSDLKDIRVAYAEQRAVLQTMKKRYKKEMEKLISRIRNNTTQKR